MQPEAVVEVGTMNNSFESKGAECLQPKVGHLLDYHETIIWSRIIMIMKAWLEVVYFLFVGRHKEQIFF